LVVVVAWLAVTTLVTVMFANGNVLGGAITAADRAAVEKVEINSSNKLIKLTKTIFFLNSNFREMCAALLIIN
jgi:hypothetical protein